MNQEITTLAILAGILFFNFMAWRHKEKIMNVYENRLIRTIFRINALFAVTLYSIRFTQYTHPHEVNITEAIIFLYFMCSWTVTIYVESNYREKKRIADEKNGKETPQHVG